MPSRFYSLAVWTLLLAGIATSTFVRADSNLTVVSPNEAVPTNEKNETSVDLLNLFNSTDLLSELAGISSNSSSVTTNEEVIDKSKEQNSKPDPEKTDEEQQYGGGDGDEADNVAPAVAEKPVIVKEETPAESVEVKAPEAIPRPDYSTIGEAYNTHFMTYLLVAIVFVGCSYVAVQYKRQITVYFNRGGRGRTRRRQGARYERLQMFNPAEDEDIIY